MRLLLPSSTYSELLKMLEQFQEFDTNQGVRNLFSAAEFGYLVNNLPLPEYGSKRDRISGLYHYLSDKRTASGEFVLILFLEHLQTNIDQNDSRYSKLTFFIAALKSQAWRLSLTSSIALDVTPEETQSIELAMDNLSLLPQTDEKLERLITLVEEIQTNIDRPDINLAPSLVQINQLSINNQFSILERVQLMLPIIPALLALVDMGFQLGISHNLVTELSSIWHFILSL